MTLILTLILGGFFLIGAALAAKVRNPHTMELYSVSIAFGSLACIVFLDFIPELAEGLAEAGALRMCLYILLGLVVLFLLDRMIPNHHAHSHEAAAPHIGYMAVIAISMHNIVEGMTIYSMAENSFATGLSLLIGIGIHNIPMGMLLYSTLQGRRRKLTIVLGIAALSTFFGGLVMFALHDLLTEPFLFRLVCIALGMILYILLVELLPELLAHRQRATEAVGIAAGALIVVLGALLA